MLTKSSQDRESEPRFVNQGGGGGGGRGGFDGGYGARGGYGGGYGGPMGGGMGGGGGRQLYVSNVCTHLLLPNEPR
jgi:hypothetical protein